MISIKCANWLQPDSVYITLLKANLSFDNDPLHPIFTSIELQPICTYAVDKSICIAFTKAPPQANNIIYWKELVMKFVKPDDRKSIFLTNMGQLICWVFFSYSRKVTNT